MTKNQLEEKVVKLFLRLNGYFTTDLIIHSEIKGNNRTQIDVLGVRFPFHLQDDREIPCSEKMDIPKDKIDILICEVKNEKNNPDFNNALKQDKESIKKMLDWIGLVNPSEIGKISDDLKNLFQNGGKGIIAKDNNYIIRPLIFTFSESTNDKFSCISSLDVLNFIWKCFRPPKQRKSCSTKYDYKSWGSDYEKLVRYFKDIKRKNVGNMDNLYKEFCNLDLKNSHSTK